MKNNDENIKEKEIFYDVPDCGCKYLHEPSCYLITLPSTFNPEFMVRFLSRRRHLLNWVRYNNRLPLSENEISNRRTRSNVTNRNIILNQKEKTIIKKVGLSVEYLNRLWVISNSKNEFALRLFLQLINITNIPKKDLNLHVNCNCNSKICILMKTRLNLLRKVTFIFYPPDLDELWSIILTQLNQVLRKLIFGNGLEKKVILELSLPEKSRDFSFYF